MAVPMELVAHALQLVRQLGKLVIQAAMAAAAVVASLPHAAAIADGGPVSSESATSWAHSGSGDDKHWGPQGRRWLDEVMD
jgi:hypothetical protein